ncbi:restriction endonuclease subunit S [Metallibacterium scheffleri]
MTMNTGQPEKIEGVIRLPSDLPNGWKKSSLAEVAEIIMGQSPSSEYYNTDGNGLPFFQGKAEFGDLYPEAVKWCSAPGKVAQKDDVLISVRAPVGSTNLAPSECCIGRGLAAIRPRHGIPPRYILHYLRSIERNIDSLGTGTTFKAISGKTLREIPVPVAPPEQQKWIVAEIEKQFSRLDEAVANLKRVKANLKRYKAAVLKAAVEGRLVETEAEIARREGRSYETGAQLLQRILETRRSQWQGKGKYKEPAAPDSTDLPELPEGWVWCSSAQLFEWSSGVGLTEKSQRTGPYPIYGGNGISGHHDEYFVEEPTLVVGRVGAHCGNVYVTKSKCWITDNAIYAKSFPNDEPLEYLQIVFTQAGLNRIAAGSGQPFVNQRMLNEVSIPLPPLDEQLRIVKEVDRRLSLLRETEARVNANLQRAERLRQSILYASFSTGI